MQLKQIVLTGLMIACLAGFPIPAAAYETQSGVLNETQTQDAACISETIDRMAAYLIKSVPEPSIGTVGGEWIIIGLGRSDFDVPERYFETYYQNAEEELAAKEGHLSSVKYTEYSRLILALTAMGKDVTNAGGYDLLEKLSDHNKVVRQGINGPVFALLALDSRDYEIPMADDAAAQAARDRYLEYILNKEITDEAGLRGGFSLSGDSPDADVTGMVLQALSGYQTRADVKAAIERAIGVLNGMQLEDGGYAVNDQETLESVAQVVVAKAALGLDAGREVRALLQFANEDGSMNHIPGGGPDQMATEQGFYALVAYERYLNQKSPLYDMSDEVIEEAGSNTIRVQVDGKDLTFTQNPVNRNGRILVPMRTIFETLGATVDWDSGTRKVTGRRGDLWVELIVGKPVAVKNGTEMLLDVPPEIINGSTMVPVRFISESLNAEVTWNEKTKMVSVESGQTAEH